MKLTSEQARILSAQRKRCAAGPGRPRVLPRCPCGAMSRRRAKKRGHRCGSKEELC